MQFKIDDYHRNTPDDDFISDILTVKMTTGKDSVTMEDYRQHGKYHPGTIVRRFGSWFTALSKAGLEFNRTKFNVPDEELLKNIEEVWINLGRQPRYQEMTQPLSKYGKSTYARRFGTWRNALRSFINYVNADAEESSESEIHEVSDSKMPDKEPKQTRTSRVISERLRFRILVRDGFTCRKCGRSPLKTPGIELHVDHIIPWSKGGETISTNLETKCKECNLGKGNAFEV